MNGVREKSCACKAGANVTAPTTADAFTETFGGAAIPARFIPAGIATLAAWWRTYERLAPFSGCLARHFASYLCGYGLSSANIDPLRSTVEFFVFESPKVLMLLLLVVFGVGVIGSFFSPGKTRKILAGHRGSVGNFLAALPGVATPTGVCHRTCKM